MEEAIPTDHHLPYLEFHAFEGTSVQSIRPRLPAQWSVQQKDRALAGLLDQMMALAGIRRPVLWFYTPMMWPIARQTALTGVALLGARARPRARGVAENGAGARAWEHIRPFFSPRPLRGHLLR